MRRVGDIEDRARAAASQVEERTSEQERRSSGGRAHRGSLETLCSGVWRLRSWQALALDRAHAQARVGGGGGARGARGGRGAGRRGRDIRKALYIICAPRVSRVGGVGATGGGSYHSNVETTGNVRLTSQRREWSQRAPPRPPSAPPTPLEENVRTNVAPAAHQGGACRGGGRGSSRGEAAPPKREGGTPRRMRQHSGRRAGGRAGGGARRRRPRAALRPLYLSFFLTRSWLVCPHFFLRQLVARGGRRA